MANTEDEIISKYIKAKAQCIKALEWYQNASEEERSAIKFSEESIKEAFDIKIYDWKISKSVSEEVEKTPPYTKAPDFLQLYDDLKTSYSDYFAPRGNQDSQKDNPDRSFLEGTLEGEHEDTTLDTSVLNNYRNWGIERVCLDGVQNHLPEDSKGTQTVIQFLINGQWIENSDAINLYGEEQLKSGIIKEIRFADDGVGFDMNNLRFLSSQKTSEDLSAGQFGEGLKLVAMTAVNLGLDMEVQSRNWSARAFGKDVVISNYRDQQIGEKKDKMKQLAWEVSKYRDTMIKGSRTIFHNPTPELIDFAIKLPDYILALRPDIKPVKKDAYYGELYDFIPGYLYCKGIFVREDSSFYSYNFNNEELNPDRNTFLHPANISDKIAGLIGFSRNYELIKDVLKKMIEYYKNNQDKDTQLPYEFLAINKLMYRLESNHNNLCEMYNLNLWKKAFEEVYGNIEDEHIHETVLKSGKEIPKSLIEHLNDYNIISLPKEWVQFLSAIGVPTDKDIIPDYTQEVIKTSLTEGYGSEIWGLDRMFLDACQNHLPSDSGGNNTFIRFQTKDEKWHDYSELSQYKDEDILRIKISDDGIGYDSMSLGLLASAKEQTGSGKWGEGLKMIAAAALRNGEQLELRSRDWMATPFFSDEVLNAGQQNEKKIKRLNFIVKKETREDGVSLEDGDDPFKVDHGYSKKIEKSSTTFVEPSPELLKHFRNIEKYILYFSSQSPMVELEDIDVLDMSPEEGRVYVKDIYIPGNHQTMYSYNLKNFNIETRDRNAITPEAMKGEIKKILERIEDNTFIRLFLSDASQYAKNAEKNQGQIFLEFLTQFNIPTKTELADKWIDCFQKYYGEKTCIRSMNSLSYSEAKAMHMGYKTVTLPDTIAKMLYSIQTRDGRSIPDYRKALDEAITNAMPFPEENLTEEDKATIERLYEFTRDILPMSQYYNNEIKHINIYTYPDDYDGDKAAGYAHYGDTINLNIDTIRRGLRYAIDTTAHEAGHAETGACDEEPDFRNFLSDLVSAVTIKLSELQESIADNGILTETTLPEFMKKYTELTKKLSIIKNIQNFVKKLEKDKNSDNDKGRYRRVGEEEKYGRC